jgi:hypothetical protein
MPVNKKDYLYKMEGPWPQPNQAVNLWPTVVHINKKDKRKFFWKISIRYLKNMLLYRFVAKRYARKNPGLIPISDEEFCDFMCNRSYSQFMYKADNEDIEKFLPGFEMERLDPSKNYFITDLYLMRNIPTQDGQHIAVTVTLFEQEDRLEMLHFKPMACYVESVPEKGQEPTKCTIYPEDGNAWDLAKFYALMGCAYRIVFSHHSTLHFPMDALNAISKTILPKDNLILKLLLPHLEYSLELNLSVQTVYTSPIKNHQEIAYCGVTGTEDEIAKLFEDAYNGIPGREKAYPPFFFKMLPESHCMSEYHKFQLKYYDCILEFVKTVVNHLTPDEKEDVILWGKYVEPYINLHVKGEHKKLMEHKHFHFPTAEKLRADVEHKLLVLLLTKIVWDMSVGHAGDHYDFGMMNFDQMPMRMRVAPPASRNVPDFDYTELRTQRDVFKHRLEWKMFYLPTVITTLKDTDYKFSSPELQKANANFLLALKQTEQEIIANPNIRNFYPLKEIARSIQF